MLFSKAIIDLPRSHNPSLKQVSLIFDLRKSIEPSLFVVFSSELLGAGLSRLSLLSDN